MKYPGDLKDDDSLPSRGLPPAVRRIVPAESVMAAAAPLARYEAEDGSEGAGLLDYWRILTRYKRAWMTFAVVGALIGFAVAFPRTPEYEASTSVEIVGLNQDFLNLKGTSPITTEGGSPSDNVSEIQTQIKLLESDSLAQRVIARLKEHAPPINETETRFSSLCRILHLEQFSAPATPDKLLELAAKSVTAKPSGQTRIIRITVDSTNPNLAAVFVNTLANEFIQQNLESRWKTAESTSDWLGKQLDDVREKLRTSQLALQQYAERSGLIFTGDRDSVSEAKLRQLQQELSAAQADRISKQSQNEMAQTSSPGTLPKMLEDPGLRDIGSKILELRRQIAELSATYTPEYGKLKRAQAELGSLEAAFQHSQAEILKGLQNQYEEAARKERLLSQAYDAQAIQVTGDSEKSIQYSMLKREVDSNQQLYETMLEHLKESTLAAAMRASNVRVVDPATVPLVPYKPKVPQTVALGLIAGAFLGAAFLVMRDHANRTIQQPGESSLLLHTTELGVIPSADLDVRRPRISQSSKPAFDSKTLFKTGLPQAGSPELSGGQRKHSALSESFRSTLLSVLLSTENSGRPKVLVITSAGPREGKSTVTSNLGIAAAEFGQKVLLIDADMRKPRLHEIFDLDNECGLSSILLKMAALNGDTSLGGVIRETGVTGLSVVTSGPTTSTATKLLYTSYMRNLLRYLRSEFDLILIDTPPALYIPDARVLGRMADNVVTVIWAGHTTRGAALATWRRLHEDGTQLLGTILNDWDPKSASRDRGYYTMDYYYGDSVRN